MYGCQRNGPVMFFDDVTATGSSRKNSDVYRAIISPHTNDVKKLIRWIMTLQGKEMGYSSIVKSVT